MRKVQLYGALFSVALVALVFCITLFIISMTKDRFTRSDWVVEKQHIESRIERIESNVVEWSGEK